jgi:signal peptidase I
MKICPRCGFHNTNERERCLKCRAILEHDWGAAQQKVKRRRLPLHRLTAGLAAFEHAIKRLFEFEVPPEAPYHRPWQAGLLSLVPGLGQLYNRQVRKGLYFFVPFAGLLATVVLTITHWSSNLWILATLAWLLWAMADAIVTATRINGQVWQRRHVLAMYSALVFYLGLFWSLSQFFLIFFIIGLVLFVVRSAVWHRHEMTRARIIATIGIMAGVMLAACLIGRTGNPFLHRWVKWSTGVIEPTIHEGDLVYVDCVSYWFRQPRVGELVFYNPRRYTMERGLDLFIINLPYAIERVIALPGDHFTRENGRFFRNGQPVAPPHQPLRPDGVRDYMDFTVPPGRYLVLISYPIQENMFGLMKATAPSPRHGISPDWADACLVARDEIIGRCVFIIHPVKHRRWLTPP